MAKIRVIAHRQKGAWPTKKGTAHAKTRKWSYLKKDTGQPGRTPKDQRWFESERLAGKLGEGYTGWPAEDRHARLKTLDREKTISSANVYHHMRGLANVTADKDASKVFATDADWVMKHLMNKQEKKALTQKARAAR